MSSSVSGSGSNSAWSTLLSALRPKKTAPPPAPPRRTAPASAARPTPRDQNGTRPLAQGKAEQCRIFKPEETHIHQYTEDQHLAKLSNSARQREAQANCGPSSAAIVLKSMGLEPPSLHDLRRSAGAVTGNQNVSAYAIDPFQLVDMVKSTAAKQGHQVHGSIIELPAKAEDAWKMLQNRIYTGMPTVLLTGNISSRGPGHYVVINSASKGELNLNDPQFENGHNTKHDFAEFKAAFERRQKAGRGNFIISFLPDLAKAGRVK